MEMVCDKCGYQNENGSIYCACCGRKLHKSSSKGSRTLLMIIVVIGIVAALLMAALFISGGRVDGGTDDAQLSHALIETEESMAFETYELPNATVRPSVEENTEITMETSEETYYDPQSSDEIEPMIDAGNFHSVYLRADGTVAAVGCNEESKYDNRGLRCDVSGWTDIVAVSASSHTVGLKCDGTVVAAGVNPDGQCDVDGWTDIVSISAGDNHTLGLRSDGTVVAVGASDLGQCDVRGWSNIIQVSAGAETSYGLRANGTVAAVGGNRSGQRNVTAWYNITAISAGIYYVVGLKSDGTVITAGISEKWKDEYSTWTDIVAISAGSTHMVGLKSDGTVVACGRNDRGQCDVQGWTDIVSVSVGMYYTLGMKKDGSLVAVGDNSYGQLSIADYVNPATTSLVNDSKTDLSYYLGTDIWSFIKSMGDMHDDGASWGIQYSNDNITVCSSESKYIDYFSIEGDCNYSIYGIEYGMSVETATEIANQSYGDITDDSPTHKRFKMPDGTTIAVYAEDTKTVDSVVICTLW